MFDFRLFDYTDEHYQAMVAVNNANQPDQPASEAFEKRRDQQLPPQWRPRRILVRTEDASQWPLGCVAYVEYFPIMEADQPGRFFLDIQVRSEYRRRGIGGSLYDRVLASVQSERGISIDAAAREDEQAAQRFLERRGFELASRARSSELDTAEFLPEVFGDVLQRMKDQGIAIKSFRELEGLHPDLIRRLYDLESQLVRDVPWHDAFVPPPFEVYASGYEDNPDLLPDAYLVALDGDRFVGLTQLWGSQATDTLLYTGLTGVLRDYRRRGIATALKVCSIGHAKTLLTSAGQPPRIRTGNEANNPMFDLNVRLGFKEQPSWLVYRKILAA